MIPILYDTNETAFVNNGICRLRDCISCLVTEERNGIYELDFEYPVTGANYDLIQLGRIVAVTHDDTGDVQPFDIVSYTKPIDGIVTFHCTHISYRQSYITCITPKDSIGTIGDAFLSFENRTTPSNPFNYMWYDLPTQFGYMAAADGLPHSVRQMLGGMEGSVIDTFGGEFEWDKWNVNLYAARGTVRDFSIRYGVNMLEYEDETDTEGAFSSCVPYWANGEEIVIGNRTTSNGSTVTGRGECVPLDLTDKFESKPTKTQLKNAAKSYMNANNTFLAGQTITVSFVRLQDMGEYADFQNLMTCRLCDTINVIFPDYKTQGQFKIVKTVWNVLEKRFEEMELGTLSTSLSEALGISQTGTDRTSSVFSSLTVDNYIYIDGHPSGMIAEEKSVADNVSVNSGAISGGDISVAKTGYTPLGVVGFRAVNASSSGTNGAFAAITHAYVNGNDNHVYYRVRNTGGSSMKVRIYMTILYVKS